MSKGKILVVLLLVVSGVIIYKYSSSVESVDEGDMVLFDKTVPTLSKVQPSKKKENSESSILAEVVPTPTANVQVDSIDKQDVEQKADVLVGETYQSIEGCRKKLKELFPQDVLEGEAEEAFFKRPEDVLENLGSYYELMSEKKNQLKKLESFIDENIESNLDYDKLNKRLVDKPFKDCGDFEEHTILSLVMDSIDENKWSQEQKKEVVNFVLKKYRDDLVAKSSTMGMAIKIGVLDEFLDEGLISERYTEELKDLIKGIHQSRMEIMNALPRDFRETKKISREDFILLREREKEESTKNSKRFVEFLERVIEGS